MLNIKSDPTSLGFLKYGPLSAFGGFIFFFEFFFPFIQKTTFINFNQFSNDVY
jgi:hypothetical protein